MEEKKDIRRNKMKAKYKIGFTFYYNNDLVKIIGIYINERGVIQYKTVVMRKFSDDLFWIIFPQAMIDRILEIKKNYA